MKTIYKSLQVAGIAALLSIPVTIIAQENNNLSRELTLEREYDPSVQDANKVSTLPAVKEPVVKKMPIDYSTFTIPTEPQREIGILPSGSIMTDMRYNKRRGYLNFGIGTYLNINGDAGYHILNTEKDQLNLFFSHRSTNGNIKYIQDFMNDEKIKAKLNDNIGGINYRHKFDQAVLKLGAKYGYSAFNYYGLPYGNGISIDTTYHTDRETNQVNQLISLNAGVESNAEASVGYLLDLDYTNFSYKYGLNKDMDGITEHSIGAKGGLNAAFGGNQRIGIAGKFNYFNYSLPTINSTLYTPVFKNYFEGTISPYYKVEGDNWNVKLGVNAMFITGDESKFFVSPNIAADIVFGGKTVLYLNADGEIGSNSAYMMSRENRYINPYNRILPSRTWLDATVGLKSGGVPGFWFNIFGGYKITDNDYFFIPTFYNTGFANVSNVLPGKSKLFRGGIEMKYAYQQFIELALKGVYNHWDVSNDMLLTPGENIKHKAYGRPKAEITAGINVIPLERLSLKLDYYLATGRDIYLPNAISEKMNDINELNFTGSYNFNDTFGAYVKLNNILFQKYEVIYGYPMQGFNVMAGININF